MTLSTASLWDMPSRGSVQLALHDAILPTISLLISDLSAPFVLMAARQFYMTLFTNNSFIVKGDKTQSKSKTAW